MDSCVSGGSMKMDNYPKGEENLLDIRNSINMRIKNIVENN